MDLADLLGDNSSQSYKEKKASGKKSDFLNVLQKSRSGFSPDVKNTNTSKQSLYSGNFGPSGNNIPSNINTNIINTVNNVNTVNTNNSNISGEDVISIIKNTIFFYTF
jgi:hypothetical protein